MFGDVTVLLASFFLITRLAKTGVPMRNVPLRGLVLAVVSVMTLTSCGDKGKNEAASQVVAKVNNGEITVHQLNFALQRTNISSPEEMKPASRQILDRLIDQELLVQAAMGQKLDRDPRVAQAMEAAKRDVLARAYLERLAAGAAHKPGEQDIASYYDEHPELFSERRIYNLREIVVRDGPEIAEKVRAQLTKSTNLEALQMSLRAENLGFAANSFVKPAEQLPLDALPRLHAMKDGEIKLSTSKQEVVVLQLVDSRSEPIDRVKARPMIEQFLANRQRNEVAKLEIKHLRDQAKLQLLGEFAKSPDADAALPTNTDAAASEPALKDPLKEGIKSLK